MLKDNDILLHDNHLLAVNKLPGIICQPSKEHPNSLEEEAKEWVKKTCNKPGAVFLHVVHRLDMPVGGIVMLAKTDKALSRMMAAVRERQVKKTYLAVVEGNICEEEGVLKDWLVHDNFCAKVVKAGVAQSHLAILHYQVLERQKERSLVKINLETGRYHQIRIQFASRGFPIVGDERYGAQTRFLNRGIALHHYQFSFNHPVKKEPICLTAFPPQWNVWQNWQILSQ